MSKYTNEFKLQIVKDYETLKLGYKTLSKKYGVQGSLLRKWIYGYQIHGASYFDKRQQSYTYKFKLDVLQYMEEHGLSVMRAAAFFNIPAFTTVLQWQKLYHTGGVAALKTKPCGRPNMKQFKPKQDKAPKEMTQEELLEEVLNLRAERDYLKKLHALIQEKQLAAKHKLQ